MSSYKEELAAKIKLMQAVLDGKVVQTKNPEGEWCDYECPEFCWDSDQYRIKPSRHTRIGLWYMENGDVCFQAFQQTASVDYFVTLCGREELQRVVLVYKP